MTWCRRWGLAADTLRDKESRFPGITTAMARPISSGTRPTNGVWFIRRSSRRLGAVQGRGEGFLPFNDNRFTADHDGDGKIDSRLDGRTATSYSG